MVYTPITPISDHSLTLPGSWAQWEAASDVRDQSEATDRTSTSDHPAAEIWLIRGWVSRCEDGEMWDVPDCGSRDEMGPALRSEDPASISRPLTQSGNQLNQSSKCDVETQLLIREFKQSALNNRSDQSRETALNSVEAAVPLITSLWDSLVSGSQVALLGPQPPERGARHKDTKLHKQKSQLCRDYHGSRPSEGDIMMPREGPKLHNYSGYKPLLPSQAAGEASERLKETSSWLWQPLARRWHLAGGIQLIIGHQSPFSVAAKYDKWGLWVVSALRALCCYPCLIWRMWLWRFKL